MSGTFRGAAANFIDEIAAQLPAEASAMSDFDFIRDNAFVLRCAAADEDTLYTIKATLKKLSGFSVREFDRRIKAERLSFQGHFNGKSNGHAAGGWKEMLACNPQGKIIPRLSNAMAALRLAPEWQGVLAFNQFALRIEKLKPPPYSTGTAGQWTNTDDIKTTEWLQIQGIDVGVATAADAAQGIAEEHGHHPIRDYLQGLKWDAKPRAQQFLSTYFGAEGSILTGLISARWLISAVARIMKPGCQVDTCLVLEGEQGIRKSTSLRALAVRDEWFTDQLASLDDIKDSSQDLAGKWIIEFSELDSFASKHDQAIIKKFIPRQSDHYRPSHARRSQDFPRQCVFCASTNQFSWALDETGGRRWLPVRCTKADRAAIERDRDQIWAEAYALYQQGIRWWFDESDPAEIRDDLREAQAARFIPDSWESAIWKWVQDNEKEYTEKESYYAQVQGRNPEPYFIQTDSILELCLKKPIGAWTQHEKNRVSKVLSSKGFERFYRRMTDDDGNPVLDANGKQRREWYYRRKLTIPASGS